MAGSKIAMVQIGTGDDASVEMFKNGGGRVTLLALLMRCRAMTVKCGGEMCGNVAAWRPYVVLVDRLCPADFLSSVRALVGSSKRKLFN